MLPLCLRHLALVRPSLWIAVTVTTAARSSKMRSKLRSNIPVLIREAPLPFCCAISALCGCVLVSNYIRYGHTWSIFNGVGGGGQGSMIEWLVFSGSCLQLLLFCLAYKDYPRAYCPHLSSTISLPNKLSCFSRIKLSES